MTNKIYFSVLAISSIISFSSCKKEIKPTEIEVLGTRGAPIPANPFNWETANYMPTNPMNIVPVPWSGQVGGIDGSMINDYHKNEGWELVYNTFSNIASPYHGQTPPGGLYFALYNKYRGVLRYYLYIPEGTATPTSAIVHGLSLFPQGVTSSPLLNFASQDFIDNDNNTETIMQSNAQQLNLLGNWVVGQYEIAYDPKINQSTFPNLGLQWSCRTLNITNVELKGTQIGDIAGTISSPSSGFNAVGILNNLSKGAIHLTGLSEVNKLKNNTTTGSPANALFTSLGGVFQGLLNNNVSGVINAVFGKSGSTQRVSLRVNTEINTTGTVTNSVGITNPFFVIPGQLNSTSADGLIPAYTVPLGVFNFAARPIISSKYTQKREGSPREGFTFTSKLSEIKPFANNYADSLIFNPSVINSSIASAELVKQDYVFLVSPDTRNYLDAWDGTSETVNGNLLIVNPTEIDFKGTAVSKMTPGWRFTIKVTPKNGAEPVYIVKTFLAKRMTNGVI